MTPRQQIRINTSTQDGFTLGRTTSYDKCIADPKGSGCDSDVAKKLGKREGGGDVKPYEGGWLWATAEEADKFRREQLEQLIPDWKAANFSVYQLLLPNGWDVDAGPVGEDGVHRLLHDAQILRKVQCAFTLD